MRGQDKTYVVKWVIRLIWDIFKKQDIDLIYKRLYYHKISITLYVATNLPILTSLTFYVAWFFLLTDFQPKAILKFVCIYFLMYVYSIGLERAIFVINFCWKNFGGSPVSNSPQFVCLTILFYLFFVFFFPQPFKSGAANLFTSSSSCQRFSKKDFTS